jgi:hypothetical protein
MSSVMFAVTSGEYSYYRVHFVCADRATAEACIAKLAAGGAGGDYTGFEIEEMPLVDDLDDIIIRPKHTVHVPDSEYSQKYGDHQSTIEWCVGDDTTRQPSVRAHISGTYVGPVGELFRRGPTWEVIGVAQGFPDEQSARKAMAEAEAPLRAQLAECQQWWDQHGGPCVLEGRWRNSAYEGRCITHDRLVDDEIPCPIAGVEPA